MIPYVRMYTEMELPKANSHSIAPHCCLNCVCVLYSYIHVLFSRLDFFLSLWPACRPGDSCWRKFSSSHSFSINKPGMPLYTECIQRPIIGGPTPFSERGAIWKWLGIRTLLYYDYTWHVKIATQPAHFPKCCQHVSSSFFFGGDITHSRLPAEAPAVSFSVPHTALFSFTSCLNWRVCYKEPEVVHATRSLSSLKKTTFKRHLGK
jgi:hypothetical protein